MKPKPHRSAALYGAMLLVAGVNCVNAQCLGKTRSKQVHIRSTICTASLTAADLFRPVVGVKQANTTVFPGKDGRAWIQQETRHTATHKTMRDWYRWGFDDVGKSSWVP